MEYYVDKAVELGFAYVSGYESNRNQVTDAIIADFERQINLLDKLFNCGKKFDPDYIVHAHRMCPDWIEKFFASFDWRILAPTYNEAVWEIFDALKKSRDSKAYNSLKDSLSSEHLRQTQESLMAAKRLGNEQEKGNILVVPAQFGLHYQGHSIRQARNAMDVNEFGLGIFIVGTMLLTHQKRLEHYNDLYINCIGDEYSPIANTLSICAPVFRFNDDKIGLTANWNSDVLPHCGSK